MTIDAVLVAVQMPYKINLLSQDKDLANLYERVSNTSDPILPLNNIKNNFDVSKYQVHTHNHELNVIKYEYPDHIKKIFEKDNQRLNTLNGKQYITLEKDDIKQLFSTKIWRDKQLNKLV